MLRLIIAVTVTLWLSTPDTLRADDPLPSSAELAEMMIAGAGSREARSAVRSVLTKTSLAGIGVPSQTTTSFYEREGRVFVLHSMENGKEWRTVFDGQHGWEIDDHGDAKLLSDSRFVLKQKFLEPEASDWRDLKVTGTTTVDGKPAYTATCTDAIGEETTIYVDKTTHLLLQTKIVRQSHGKDVVEVTKEVDYKDFGGLKVSTKQLRYTNTHLLTFTVDVQLNADPPAGAFEVPEKVKQLIAEKEAAASTQPASTQASESGK